MHCSSIVLAFHMDHGGSGIPAWREALADAAQAAGRVAGLGWAPEAAGNLSLRLPIPAAGALPAEPLRAFPLPTTWPRLAGQWFLISLAGSTMVQIAAEPAAHTAVCQVRDDAQALLARSTAATDEAWQPTSELAAHLAVQHCLTPIGRTQRAVLHAHLPNLARVSLPYAQEGSTELNAALHEVAPQLAEAVPRGVEFVAGAPGSLELGQRTARAAAQTPLVVWPGHGALAWAATLNLAVSLLELAELAASAVLHRCRLVEPLAPPAPLDSA